MDLKSHKQQIIKASKHILAGISEFSQTETSSLYYLEIKLSWHDRKAEDIVSQQPDHLVSELTGKKQTNATG